MATFLQLPKDKLLQCKQLLIPAGFWVDENENVYTPEISVLYRLATNKKDLSELEKSYLVAIYTNRTKTAAHSGDKISESSIVVRVRRL